MKVEVQSELLERLTPEQLERFLNRLGDAIQDEAYKIILEDAAPFNETRH